MSDAKKRVLRRFLKGLAAAGIAYLLVDGAFVLPEFLPIWSMPVITAAFLAAQKALQR